jgi:hypothetical protein
MGYFIVFQNKTFYEERAGRYLWAPKSNKSGHSIFHWDNMMKVKKGDIIFSSVNGYLVSINVAISDCYSCDNPFGFTIENIWEKSGWKVDVQYNNLINNIYFKSIMEELFLLLPNKYSPFNKNGGGNQGYLFEIGSRAGLFLIQKSKAENMLNLTTSTYKSSKLQENIHFHSEINRQDVVINKLESSPLMAKEVFDEKDFLYQPSYTLDSTKDRMFYVFQNGHFDTDEINNFLNPTYFKNILKVEYPLLKRVDNINMLYFDMQINGLLKYWPNIVKLYNKSYIILADLQGKDRSIINIVLKRQLYSNVYDRVIDSYLRSREDVRDRSLYIGSLTPREKP